MDCGQLYVTIMDLQKHLKRGCPEADDSDIEEEACIRKRPRYEDDKSDADNESDHEDEVEESMDDDEEGLKILVEKAYIKYDGVFGVKVEQLMDSDDVSEENARSEASSMLRSKYKKALIKEYQSSHLYD